MSIGQRLQLCTALACLACACGLLVAHFSPANGWEWSLYESTPLAVWVFLLSACLVGFAVVVWGVVKQGVHDSRLWMLGVLPVALAKAAIVAVPYARGYVSWRGDSITHMGVVRDIVTSGAVPVEDFYPISHVFGVALSMISGTGVPQSYNLGPSVFVGLHVLACLALALRLFGNGPRAALCVALCVPVFVGAMGAPNNWSALWLPVVFLVGCRGRAQSDRALLLLFVAICPLFHPLTSLVAAVALAGTAIVLAALRRFARVAHNTSSWEIAWGGVAIVGFAVFWRWINEFRWFEWNIRTLVTQMLELRGVGSLSEIEGTLGRLGLDFGDSVALFVRMYGAHSVLLLLATVGSVLAIRQLVRRQGAGLSAASLGMVVVYCICAGGYGAYVLGVPGSGAIAGERLLRYAVLFAPFGGAFLLPGLVSGRRLAAGVAVVSLLGIALLFQWRALYYDPYVLQPNLQVTAVEVAAVRFMGETKCSSDIVLNGISNPRRIADWAFAVDEREEREGFALIDFVPDHFGYDSGRVLADSAASGSLFMVSSVDRSVYHTVWKSIGRFTRQDFERLDADVTVARIYATPSVEVSRVIAP